MAELERWSSAQTRQQYLAVTLLRWQVFRAGLRRRSGAGDLVATIVVLPIFVLIGVGASVFTGSMAALAVSSGHLGRVSLVLWGVFAFCQVVNINIGSPATTFDPTQLIRFPMTSRSYALVRLFFGALTPGNIMAAAMSLAVAIGVGLADPRLWAYALVAMAIFAVTNVLFTRMAFSWVDRWLATRRAREVFTALIFLFSIGIQWANFQFNPAYGAHHHSRSHASQPVDSERVSKAKDAYHRIQPYVALLPPGLAAGSLEDAAATNYAGFAEESAGGVLFGLAFLGIFWLRMDKEFRGESLSDEANAVRTKVVKARHAAAAATPSLAAAAPQAQGRWGRLPAIVEKEFLYMRRNTGLFYGLVGPLVYVALMTFRFANRGSVDWIFPAGLAFALLGVFPVSYNSFGLDGTGAQFYFLSPAPLSEVLLGKNLLNALLAAVEGIAVLALVIYLTGVPGFAMLMATGFWALATMLVELTVGNYQSISSPKRIDPGRTAQKQARPLNGFLSMGILALSAGAGWSLAILARNFGMMWALPLEMLVLAVGAAAIYWTNLQRMDAYAFSRRELLFEELGRKI